jgi:hypothetical protein
VAPEVPGDAGHREDAESALKALSDIALVKRLTGQVEHNAVVAARQGGKSWSAIGTALGIDAESAEQRRGEAICRGSIRGGDAVAKNKQDSRLRLLVGSHRSTTPIAGPVPD